MAEKLGALPLKSSTKALLFSDFVKVGAPDPPDETNYWKTRASFPLVDFGNREFGDCTIAKQALATLRMERLETKFTPYIKTAEVVRKYKDMSTRLYHANWPSDGSYSEDADTGAYEIDALSEWRKPDLTFKDYKGNPQTIDAFTRLDPSNLKEIKRAIWLSPAHGIAFCINLPRAFQNIRPPEVWDIPEGQSLIGDWMPGSWGRHSMWGLDYSKNAMLFGHTWRRPNQLITFRAMAAYCDEFHSVIDSIDSWIMKPLVNANLNLNAIKDAVNSVSAQKIK